MATSAFIVEILVVGAMAFAWIGGALALWVMPIPMLERTKASVGALRDFVPLLVLPTLALTYTVGWMVNFCSERVLKPFFQRGVRDRRFGDEPGKYELARIVVLQRGSPDLISDLQVDRHIIRVARGAVLNFSLTAIVLFGYALRGFSAAWGLAVICLAFASVSFAQWFTRYRSHYVKVSKIRDMLAKGGEMRSEPSPPAESQKAVHA